MFNRRMFTGMTPRRAWFISPMVVEENLCTQFLYQFAPKLPFGGVRRSGWIGYNIMKRKDLYCTLGIGAFGTQTVYRNTGR
jgi:hypothetical protein